MKNRLTLILGAAALLFAPISSSYAQTTGCKWTVTDQTVQPTCSGQCNGEVSISIANGSGLIFSYLWSTGATTANLFNLCEGQYMLTITDDKGCSETFTYSIVEPAPVLASCTVVSDETSSGAADGELMASASGGTAPYSFEWQTTPPVVGATLSGLSAGTYFVIASDDNGCQASTFCVITTLKKDTCSGFRTQTQGGWGQCHQNGNNPGTYLFANFAGAFPNGLTVGCNNTLELSSAQAVCEFLPSGKKPQALPSGTITDPGKTYRNVLAGQLTALMISVSFDAYDEGFSIGDADLGDQVVGSGPFAGMSVYDLLDEANEFIGGCSSNYTASQFNSVLTSINENYVDGNMDNGFLVCPDDKKRNQSLNVPDQDEFRTQVYPNPFSGTANIEIISLNDGELVVELYTYTGQRVMDVFNGTVLANSNTILSVDASSLQTGVYFAKIMVNGTTENIKLFIQK